MTRQDTLSAHHRSFAPQWQRTIEESEQQVTNTKNVTKRCYNATACSLPEIQMGSNVAVQNPRTKLWDTYGVVTSMGPYHQYYVKTGKGNVLVRNRCFLWCRAPVSVLEGDLSASQPPGSQATNPPTTGLLTPPRKSDRIRKLTQWLIEDPSWNWHVHLNKLSFMWFTPVGGVGN